MFFLAGILKEQSQSITIAGQGAEAATTRALKVINEKGLHRVKNGIGLFHGFAGWKPKLRLNLREAAARVWEVARRYL
jgi:hypothetical protein